MKTNLFLTILLITVVFNSLLWIATVPFNHAPNEFSHYSIPKFIINNDRYPIFGQDATIIEYDDQKAVSLSSLPPMAYLIQAGLMKLGNFLVKENHQYLIARLSSLLAILIYLYFSWKTVLCLFDNLKLQRCTLILLAFIPGVTFISSYVNSDSWMLAFASFLIWLTVRLFQHDEVNDKDILLLGIAAGLLILNRYNGYILLIFPALAVLSLKSVRHVFVFALSTLVIGGWWFLHNFFLFGQILPVGKFMQVHYFIDGAHNSYNIPIIEVIFQRHWLWATFKSFWASFDWSSLYFPNIYYVFIALLCLISLIGIIRQSKSKMVLIFSSIIFLSIFQSLLSSADFAYQPEGRYLYHTLPLLGYLFILGLTSFWKSFVWQKFILDLVVIGIISFNILSLTVLILPKYYLSLLDFLEESTSKPLFFTPPFLIIYIIGIFLGFSILIVDFLRPDFKNGRIDLSL